MENISKISKYLFFGCLFILIVLSAIPRFHVESYEVSDGFSIRLDYWGHFVAYFALVASFLLWRKEGGWSLILTSLVIGLSLAFLLEYQQLYIIGRTFNPVDIIYNVAGALVGVTVSNFVKSYIT